MTRFSSPCEYGIPVKTDGEQNNYLPNLEVQVMLDTLRVSHNPLRKTTLWLLMKSPMFGFDEDELARLSLQKAEDKVHENLYEKLVNAQKMASSQKGLIHTALAEKLKQFMDISSSCGACMPKPTLSMTWFGRFTTTVFIMTMLGLCRMVLLGRPISMP